jgi:transcriptional regulator with XRE-family HTH domain
MKAARRMPKPRNTTHLEFGERLTDLRKRAGLTQQELADAVDISRRMIAYYEGDRTPIFAVVLPKIAATLGISTDELLGVVVSSETVRSGQATKLLRRLEQVESLDAADQKQVMQLIDTLVERAQLKRSKHSHPSKS